MNEIERKILKLKSKLENVDEKELISYISFILLDSTQSNINNGENLFDKTNVDSPKKQLLYLAGLLMSTKKSSHYGKLNEDNFLMLLKEVNEITNLYLKDMHRKIEHLNIIEKDKISIAIENFLYYFNTSNLRYPEQEILLINNIFKKLDDEIYQLTSLHLDDYFLFYSAIKELYKKPINDFVDKINSNYTLQEFGDLLATSIRNNLGTINICDLYEFLDKNKVDKLLSLFSLERESLEFNFYNSPNPLLTRPLIKLNKNQLCIIDSNYLIESIDLFLNNLFSSCDTKIKEKYARIKGDCFEKICSDELNKIMGDGCVIHHSVCEKYKSKEHDLLIEYKDYLIVAEIKSSKYREPYFDPIIGFERLKEAFDSKSGIGYAYKQASNLIELLKSKDNIILYENMKDQLELNNCKNKKLIPIIITLENYGPLSVNCTRLLDKNENVNYPWISNFGDLNCISMIQKYCKKTGLDFLKYLEWRLDNYPFIHCDDEVEILSIYYYNNLPDKMDLFIPPLGKSLIDKIYFNNQGIPYEYNSKVFIDKINSSSKKMVREYKKNHKNNIG